MSRIPLAWKNLTHSPPRLLLAMGGVAFAVVLMFMQTGFRNVLFDSTVQPIEELDADLIVVSRARYSLSRSSRFPREQLVTLQGLEGVATAEPLYIEMLAAVLRSGRQRARPIRVIAFDLDRCPLANREIRRQLDLLRAPGAAPMDRRTKPSFGLSPGLADRGEPQQGELTGRQLTVVGAFNLGTDFANEGTLVMSDENFAGYFPLRGDGRPLSIVDLGLLKVPPGRDPAVVRRQVAAALPDSLEVFTRQQFRAREIRFWDQSTPVGIIFAIGTIMGFVVGVIICYQVIYTDITDHMAEFATLKAMGYSGAYFTRLVIAESVYLSLLGFVPGLLISWALFAVVAQGTGLLMQLTLLRAGFVLLLTLVMCVLSGAIALFAETGHRRPRQSVLTLPSPPSRGATAESCR